MEMRVRSEKGNGGARGRIGRRIVCLVAVALVGAVIAPALAAAKPPPITKTDLALGDSFAFGYSLQQYNEGVPNGDPATGFEHGYVNEFFKKVVNKKKEFQLVNDGCPFETTESFVGKNETLLKKLNEAMKSKQEAEELPPVSGTESEPEQHKEANCEYQEEFNSILKSNGKGGPLHNPYPGESQLQNALKTITTESEAGKPVEYITLDVGLYDVLHVVAQQEAAVRKEIEEKVLETVLTTEAPEFAAQVAAAAKARIEAELKSEHPNLLTECASQALKELLELKITEGQIPLAESKCLEAATLVATLKDEAEHNYKGEVEALVAAGAAKYVSEHNYELNSEGETKAAEAIKEKVAELVGQIRSNLDGILYAIRNAATLGLGGVNYSGKIMFLSNYSAYGKLFQYAIEGREFTEAHGGQEGPYAVDNGRCAPHYATQQEEVEGIDNHCPAATLRVGLNTILALINNWTYVSSGQYQACNTDPEPYWDPGNAKKPLQEPERLNKFTNMTNTTESNEKLDGPDVSPTPAGYVQLAKEMAREAKHCAGEGL
jgi:hypothetical protein